MLDTKVLATAARSRAWASFAILHALRRGRFIALASVPRLPGYEAMLERPEHLPPGKHTPAMTGALATRNAADFARAAKRFRLSLLTPGEFYQRHLLSPTKED